jgi:DNA polymerase-3 subunit alpha
MESLAYSGGFDSFGIMREQYFAADSKGVPFLDTLMRYGQLFQAEKMEAQTSLFGGSKEVAISRPVPPKAAKWATIEKLNKERELVGIYLSAHPLDEYGVILNKMCNTKCKEIHREADKEALAKREEITFGGIVTSVMERFSQKTSKPFGIVTIEDFDGSGELAFFGEEWGRWRGMFVEGSSVYVRGRYVQKYPNSQFIDFRTTGVEYLQTVRDSKITRFTITCERDALDDTVVNELTTLISDSPGHTELYVQILDREHNTNLLLRSTSRTISLSRDLIRFIEQHPRLGYQVN